MGAFLSHFAADLYQPETPSGIANGGSDSLQVRGFVLTQNEITHRVQLFNNLRLPIAGRTSYRQSRF
jgi:hypothetical protein